MPFRLIFVTLWLNRMIESHVEKIETLHDAHIHNGWCYIL